MKERKKKGCIIALIIIIILLLLIILGLLFWYGRSFTIVFDTNGGSLITNVEVKNGEVVKLPEVPIKEGYKFIGWVNEEGKVITNGTKVDKDLTLKAEWVSNKAKTITAKFNTDGGSEIDGIIIEKGKNILLPVEPVREGYIFVGWADSNGKLVTGNLIVNSNITLKAIWVEKGTKTSTIKFNTDGGNNIGSIIVENGKVILLPINPTKEGYAFAGWVDENGNAVTKDTIVNSNMIIKAKWKQPYTCPSDCKSIGDGSKCTREVTKNMTTISTCPTGYKLVNGQCLDMASRYHANSIDVSPWWSCNSSSEYMYSEIDESGMGAMMWCAKKTNKISTKGCPSGYTQIGSVCKKTETVKCKTN